MLVWLDAPANRKGHPNENLARELMELFTLGIGNYSEQDIKEAARAFTGHTLTRELTYTFAANQHDTKDKTFQGQTGNFDADDVLAIMVRNPASARFVTSKLFSYFAYENPDPCWVMFSAADDDAFARFCTVMGRPELAKDERFRTNAARVRNNAVLTPIISWRTQGRSPASGRPASRRALSTAAGHSRQGNTRAAAASSISQLRTPRVSAMVAFSALSPRSAPSMASPECAKDGGSISLTMIENAVIRMTLPVATG